MKLYSGIHVLDALNIQGLSQTNLIVAMTRVTSTRSSKEMDVAKHALRVTQLAKMVRIVSRLNNVGSAR